MIYCLYIFHRQHCIFYVDWNRVRKPPRKLAGAQGPRHATPEENGQREEQKLLSGLLFSLKSFSQKLDPKPKNKGQISSGCNAFNSFTTSLYKLHYYETPNGYKFVLMTDPKVPEMKDALGVIYSDLFVTHVVRDPSYEVGDVISSPPFEAALTTYVSNFADYNKPCTE